MYFSISTTFAIFVDCLIVFGFVGWLLVIISVKNQGNPDDPAPLHVLM
jgi:hypothetical protein